MSFVNKWPIHFPSHRWTRGTWFIFSVLEAMGWKKGESGDGPLLPLSLSITNVAAAERLLTGRTSVTGETSDQRNFTNTTSQPFQTSQVVNIRSVLKKADVFFRSCTQVYILLRALFLWKQLCGRRRGCRSVTHTEEGKAQFNCW